MKQNNRRKFLLFIGHAGLLTAIGCHGQCSFLIPTSSSNYEPPVLDESKLEKRIIELLDAGKTISLDWDCGGDEAIIKTYINNKKIDYRDEFGLQMNLMVMNILDLPDAGEFSMKGKGVVIKEENNIYLECESFMKGYVDYDFEEKKVLGWKEVNEKQEQYSGRSLVFPK